MYSHVQYDTQNLDVSIACPVLSQVTWSIFEWVMNFCVVNVVACQQWPAFECIIRFLDSVYDTLRTIWWPSAITREKTVLAVIIQRKTIIVIRIRECDCLVKFVFRVTQTLTSWFRRDCLNPRNPNAKMWNRFNDRDVSPIHIDQIDTRNGYLLFYQQQ